VVKSLRNTSEDRPLPDPKSTGDDFAELWTGALQRYKEKTGVDIQDRKDEFVQLFEDCEDSGHALAVLENLPIIKKPGARTPWVKMKDSVKKVLDVVILLNGLAAEMGNVVCQYLIRTTLSVLQRNFKGTSPLWETDLCRNRPPFEGEHPLGS
jgi:hypothetical protein